MTDCVKTGLDRMQREWPSRLRGARVGLLAHPASVHSKFHHAVDVLAACRRFRLSALFGPQHGFLGQTQDNMIEWRSYADPASGLPVHSLYGRTRKPTRPMLADIDALVVDMQDVGSRYYTFIWTMELCMEAAAKSGKAVVVLDRPNPITGGHVEGPMLRPEWASFVGLRPLPVRHGLTIGEVALYLRREFHPDMDLHVIPMEGWNRAMWFEETGLPWVLPSPNMPTVDTALVYPGMCLLEGTNLSEGRGTTRPFEIFGAPFIDPARLTRRLSEFRLPGVVFRPTSFLPTFQKHAGRLCGGAQIHVVSREKFRPFLTAVAILKAVRELHPDALQWKAPPYEYEREKMPIDILAGTDRVRLEIDGGTTLQNMSAWWRRESDAFRRSAGEFILYK